MGRCLLCIVLSNVVCSYCCRGMLVVGVLRVRILVVGMGFVDVKWGMVWWFVIGLVCC